MRQHVFPLALAPLLLVAGCAGSPAAPFNNLKSAPLTAFRLQNYEPPPPPPNAAPVAPTAPGMIPGLPPEIQKWVQAGASMLPPGLLPPGLLPGQAPAAAPPPAQDTSPRFHGFR